jgi:hypothetical protein
MFLHIRLTSAQTLVGAMTSPVEQTSESARNQCHWQVPRKAKKYHAQSGAEEASKQYLLPADPIAESTPEDTADALGERERRRNHANIHSDPGRIAGNFEVVNHEIGVWEDGHECDWLAYPAECCCR